MTDLRILADLRLPEAEAQFLRDGVAPHELLLSKMPAGSALAQARVDPRFATADIVFGQPAAEAVLASERLRWIHISSAGYARYDTREFRAVAKAKGLIVTNSSTIYAEACADQVLAFMLAQSRRLPEALQTRCSHTAPEWQQLRNTMVPLRGAKVLILGFGAIARRLVKLLEPFEMKITALRRQAGPEEGVSIITEEQLASALGTADHVINILPASEATERFVSTERLAAMAPGAVFYNIGRGNMVDQVALHAALRSGHIGAAWLDVTDPEPLPDDHPLRNEERCFITPHIAGGQKDEIGILTRHFLANLRLFLAGAPLRDRVV